MLEKAQAEADRRVAAAEQRAAEAEARAEEAHRLAVRLESEIEERVMQGTVDVRREAEERVRGWSRRSKARRGEGAGRAEEQLQAESERIRGQAEQREERSPRRRGRDQGERQGARREVLAAANETAPTWARNECPLGRGIPHVLAVAGRGSPRRVPTTAFGGGIWCPAASSPAGAASRGLRRGNPARREVTVEVTPSPARSP